MPESKNKFAIFTGHIEKTMKGGNLDKEGIGGYVIVQHSYAATLEEAIDKAKDSEAAIESRENHAHLPNGTIIPNST